MEKNKSLIVSAIILLVLLVGGFFVARVGYLYYQIDKGNVSTGSTDFVQQMSISQALSQVEQSDDLVDVSVDDDPWLGTDDADLVIIEFADFSCPYCQDLSDIVRRLAVGYGDRVQFVYRDFPVSEIHPNAQMAAEAAECADEQGKFWEYHDKLYQNQGDFDLQSLRGYAAQIGIDAVDFSACINSGRMRSEVQNDYADGVMAGVVGTPTFFFNGLKVSGAIPEDIFEQIIIGFLQ
jgi:protein-disulfide isomerase